MSPFRRALLALTALLAFASPTHAQLTTITAASGSLYVGGQVISSGTVVFAPVDGLKLPISIHVSTGGLDAQPSTAHTVPGYSCTVTAGAITGTCQIPDSIAGSPSGFYYNVTLTDNARHISGTIWQIPGITGFTWPLDAYLPPDMPASEHILEVGPPGAAATIAIGTVTTGSPGSPAAVTNGGTPYAAILEIQLPAGATGPTGPSGPTVYPLAGIPCSTGSAWCSGSYNAGNTIPASYIPTLNQNTTGNAATATLAATATNVAYTGLTGTVPTWNQNTTGNAAGLSATLVVGSGGTGGTTHTAHGVMLGEGSSAEATTAAGTSGQCLLSGGASADPSYSACPSTAANAITSTTTNGIGYGGASSTGISFLAGNTAATDQVLVSHGTGSAAAAPTFTNAPALSAASMTSFPTLNQNTTGNAATATNVAYTGLTGTVPTWNQNTTGNAATATTAGNLTAAAALPNGTTATTQTTGDTSGKLATDAFVASAVLAGGTFTNPMSAIGQMISGGTGGALTFVVANSTTSREFLIETGDGTNGTNPAFGALVSGDIPNNAANTTGNAATATTAGNLTAAAALPNGTTATTQSPGDNTTNLATTAYVTTAVAAVPAEVYPGVGIACSTGSAWCTSYSASNQIPANYIIGANSIAANGYYTLPSGLIEEWGTSSSVSGTGSSTITLPLTFPNHFYSVSITPNVNNGGAQSQDNAQISSTSQFTIHNNNGSASTFTWIAIGN